jgi:hypothetical protein
MSTNIFEDKNFKTAFNALPDDQKEMYKKQGEYMYSKNYEQLGSEEGKMMEAAAYIAEGLKSGLTPSFLSESEREVMRSVYGTEWFKKYNYKSESD